MGAAKWIRFAVLLSFSGLFFWLFYLRFWKPRACTDAAQSGCATPAGDSLIGGGAFWIVPAILFVLLAALTLRKGAR